MFSNRSAVALLAALLILPCAASAQSSPASDASSAPGSGAPQSPHHSHGHNRSFMHTLRALGLSDAQKQQVASFRAAERQANQNADPATKRANALAMRRQILGILTPAQRAQLAAQRRQGSMAQPVPQGTPAP